MSEPVNSEKVFNPTDGRLPYTKGDRFPGILS